MDARDRAILRLAVPALGGLAIEPLYVLVDTAIVGHLGTAPLGGLALASAVLTTATWLFNFLAYGTTARVAFLRGAGRHAEAAGVAAQGLWVCAVVGTALAALIAAAGRPLATLLGGSGAVLDAATTYLRISAVGVPFILVALVGHGYLRGLHDTRTPLWVALGANAVNVVLEVAFVYGFDLGVAGSAWGTVIAQTGAGAAFLLLIARSVRRSGARLRPVGREVRGLLAAGRHLVVRTGALLTTLSLATAVAARVGPVTVAGHQIALQIETFLALSVDALAIAAQAITGSLLGEGDLEEARRTGRRLVRIGLWVGAALAVVVVATSPVVARIFTTDPAVVRTARDALLVVGLMQVAGALVFVLDGVLMGASDFRFLQWATVAALASYVPFAMAVLRFRHLGIVGVWSGLLVWMLVRLAFNARRFAGARWPRAAAALEAPRPTPSPTP